MWGCHVVWFSSSILPMIHILSLTQAFIFFSPAIQASVWHTSSADGRGLSSNQHCVSRRNAREEYPHPAEGKVKWIFIFIARMLSMKFCCCTFQRRQQMQFSRLCGNLLNLLFNRRARTMPKLFFGQACKVAGEWPKFSFPEVNGDTSIHFPRTQTLHLRLSLARCSDEKLFFFVHQTDSAVCSWHRDIATTLRRENVFTLGEHKF